MLRIGLVALVVLGLAPVTAAGQARRDGSAPGLAPLRGVLVDSTSGAPVRRARVEISTGVTRFDAVMSDADGRFALDVPLDAGASVRITKAGYATHTRIVSSQQLRDAAPLLVALDRGGAIVGRAVDESGQPVPILALMVVRPRDNMGPVSAFTPVTLDERGEFRIGGLAPGRYTIDNVVAPATMGLRADAVEVQVDAGHEVPIVLTFEARPSADSRSVTRYTYDGRTGVVTTVTSSAPTARPSGSRAIRGVVTSTAGTPIGEASVTAIGSGGVRRSANTDALGQFTVDGLMPGSYSLEAVKRGYVRAEVGQHGLDLPGVKVTLGADADIESVTIALPLAGAVSGTVYDEVGDPLQDAAVQLLRVRRSADGLTPIRDAGSTVARTDDRGQFRAAGLLPGDYVAAVSFPARLVADGVRRAYATTFWPAAADLRGAAPLDIRSGEEVAGLTVTVPLVPVVRLAGVVITSAGTPAAGTVRLMLAANSQSSADMRTMTVGPKGEFAFDDVTAGEYVVQAAATGGPAGSESGRRVLTVTHADPEPLLIRTSPGSTLSGRFVLEGASAGELMWGYAAAAVADGVSWAPATASNLGGPIADGEPFALSALTGPTRLRVTSEDTNWYLKSIVIDGFDAADQVFDFGFEGRPYTDVQIVFSRLGATISGRATDERGRPVRDYAVYVFPVERDKWIPGSRWVRMARAASDGAFSIPSLPPGSYSVVAVDRLDVVGHSADPGDAALLDALSPYAASVVVGESERRAISLRLVRR